MLNVVSRCGKPEFTNADVYAQAGHFQLLYPENRHVREKIRQQLQVLRDTGFLTHTSRGGLAIDMSLHWEPVTAPVVTAYRAIIPSWKLSRSGFQGDDLPGSTNRLRFSPGWHR